MFADHSIILAYARLCRHDLFLVAQRAFAGDQFKVFVKAGEVIEPAFITKLFYTQVVFDQQFTGMSYPYFDQELRIGLSGAGFKIPAE